MLNSLILLAVLFLVVGHFRTGRRIKELQSKQNSLESRLSELANVPSAPGTSSRPKAAQSKPAHAAVPTATLKEELSATPVVPEPLAQEPVPTPAVPHEPKRSYFAAEFWSSGRWVYAIAAVSLGLAGIFLVQYGIENGLLSPGLRVSLALVLGAALIGAAEYLRRKGGDGSGDLFAHLPSTLAAGGLLMLFAAIYAAQALYGIIGTGLAFAGLALVGLLAVLIGWFYGPLLAAIGILGAIAAPFAVGGGSDQAFLLQYYFAGAALVGLTVDSMRRWAWLSYFAVALAALASFVVWNEAGGHVHFAAFGLIIAAAAAAIPTLNPRPNLQGPMLGESLVFRGVGVPDTPVRLAALGFAIASGFSVLIAGNEAGSLWIAVITQAILFAMAAIWLRQSRATENLALLPWLALLAGIALEANDRGGTYAAWRAADLAGRNPETSAPTTISILVAVALGFSLVAAWRSSGKNNTRLVWAGGAALLAPVATIILEFLWSPSLVLGPWLWAIHLMVVAAAMVAMAVRCARIDGEDRDRFSLFTLSAMSMIAFAMMMILSEAALTVALGFMALVAAWMQRQWGLWAMSWFIQAAVSVAAYRLIADPGLLWALNASIWPVCLSFLCVIVFFGVAQKLFGSSLSLAANVALDSGVWTFGPIFASVLLARWLDKINAPYDAIHFWAGLFATVWLVSTAAQLYRFHFAEGILRIVRAVLAGLFGLAGVGLVLINFALAFLIIVGEVSDLTFGPMLFGSLSVGYLLPALPLAAISWRMPHVSRWLRLGARFLVGALATTYVTFEIRRFWRGDDLSVPGYSQPELYTYTLALLVVAVVLLALAYGRRSPGMRKAALVVTGLAIAKVYLVDMSGLSGITRVLSFLVLGMVLAGLALVNNWFVAKEKAARGPQ